MDNCEVISKYSNAVEMFDVLKQLLYIILFMRKS